MMIAPNSRARKSVKGEYGGIWGEEGNGVILGAMAENILLPTATKKIYYKSSTTDCSHILVIQQ